MGSMKKISKIFLIPSLVGIGIFYIYPFFQIIFYSFVVSPVNQSFVGLQHYKSVFANDLFILSIKNTIIFLGIGIPMVMGLSVVVALALNQQVYNKQLIKSTMIMPLVVPTASIVIFFKILFNNDGLLNELIGYLGMQSIEWEYGSTRIWVYLMMYIWKNIGYNTIIFLGGLASIPTEYYEVCKIEGANAWQSFRYVTSIYLAPTTFFVLIISIVNGFKIFKEIYALDGAYPHESVYMMQHYINNLFTKLEYGKLVTANLLFSLFIYTIIGSMLYFQKRMIQGVRGDE